MAMEDKNFMDNPADASQDQSLADPENDKPETKQPTVEELMAQLAQEQAEKEKLKTSLSKVNTEAAEYKKQLRAKQTAEEQVEEEKLEQERIHKEYVANLERTISITAATNRYLDMGMDKEMAKKTAEAEVDKLDGYEDLVSSNIKKLMENRVKAAEAEWLASRPDVQAGNGEGEDEDPFLKGFGE